MTVRGVFCVSVVALCVQQSIAQTPVVPATSGPVYQQAVHGGVGLIQTPTARFNPDGEFSLNYQDIEQYRFWSASLQLFPWMETTMRYFDARTVKYSSDPNFSGDQSHKDKGIDAKFRLWQESRYLPQLAVGFRDFGGTGLLSSEYISVSKRWQDVDLHLGLGFGYMGRRNNIQNPFCKVSDRFCSRQQGFSGSGGQVEFGSFFRGPTSLYGGLSYQTPWQPLSIAVEFDPNNYQTDFAGKLPQDSPWNYALRYKASDKLDLHLSYQRGNTVGFGVSYRLNFNTASQVKIVAPAPAVPEVRPHALTQVDRERLADALFNDAGFMVNRYQLEEHVVRVEGNSRYFRDQTEFLTRASSVLANQVPDTVDEFQIVEVENGLPQVETRVDAKAFVAAATHQAPGLNVQDSFSRREPTSNDRPYQLTVDDSGYYTAVSTYWLQTFGSPETFYMYQGGLLLSAGYNFNPQFSVHGTSRVVALTNFDEFNFKVDAIDTGVPRVRTYVREYVSGHDVSLDNLFASWKNQLTTDWYGTMYAGLLEQMYSGAGAEVLHRKVDSRFAYGVDLNYVAQRDFDKPFGLRDYRVWTGHANFYWQPEFWQNVLLKVKVGRYLAGDRGATFELNRRFDSGIVVGAYATKTNLSAAQYGEGSFTKGFFISIPFDLFVIRPAKGEGRFPWVPISRDGGQPLQRPVDLYNLTETRSPFGQ